VSTGIRRTLLITSECYNIPDTLQDQIRSLETYGICIELFELPNCDALGSSLHIIIAESNLEERDSLGSMKLCGKKAEDNFISPSLIIGITICVILVVFLLAAIVVTHYRTKYQRKMAKLTYKEIQKFFTRNGNINSSDLSNDQESTDHNIQNAPYDTKYEIDRSLLNIGECNIKL